MKYLILIIPIILASCKTLETDVPIEEALNMAEDIRTDYQNIPAIFNDPDKAYMTVYYVEQDNMKRIIEFFDHINFKKFSILESNQTTAISNSRVLDIYYSREGSEYIVRFRFKFFIDDGKWKLIHLDWKSQLLEVED